MTWLKISSTFSDYEFANKAFQEVLKQNHDDIVDWTKRAKEGAMKPFYAEKPGTIWGHGFTKDGERFETDKTTAVLIKVNGEIKVKTSYPIK